MPVVGLARACAIDRRARQCWARDTNAQRKRSKTHALTFTHYLLGFVTISPPTATPPIYKDMSALWTVILDRVPELLLSTSRKPQHYQRDLDQASARCRTVACMLEAARPQNYVGQARLDSIRALLFRNVVTLSVSIARKFAVDVRRGMVFDYVRNKTGIKLPGAHAPPYVHRQRAIESWDAMQNDFFFGWEEAEDWADALDKSDVRMLRCELRGSALCPRDWAG